MGTDHAKTQRRAGDVLVWVGFERDARGIRAGIAGDLASGEFNPANPAGAAMDSAACGDFSSGRFPFARKLIGPAPDRHNVAEMTRVQQIGASRMKRGNALIVALMVAVVAGVFPFSAWAGGELTDEDKDDGDTTTGPYGFVKDTRGAVVAEATVTVDIKNRGQLVTQTNVLGAYRIPTFGIEIKPEEVTISCKK